jgi:hypothetical protein
MAGNRPACPVARGHEQFGDARGDEVVDRRRRKQPLGVQSALGQSRHDSGLMVDAAGMA